MKPYSFKCIKQHRYTYYKKTENRNKTENKQQTISQGDHKAGRLYSI